MRRSKLWGGAVVPLIIMLAAVVVFVGTVMHPKWKDTASPMEQQATTTSEEGHIANGNGHGDGCAFMRLSSSPAFPKPEYLETINDPAFGTRTVRITDPGGMVPGLGMVWDDVARHHYSLDQAWNADQTLMMLDRGTKDPLFLDGKTYRPVFQRDGPGESRWHPLEPGLQIFVNNDHVGLWDVRSDETRVVGRFPGYSKLAFGPSKGNPSDDGRIIALAGRDGVGRQVAFAYDLQARKKYPDIHLGNTEFDYVTVSPRGDLIVLNGVLDRAVASRGDQTRVFDLKGRRMGADWLEYGRPSHFDLTVDEDGDQVAVGISKSEPDQGLIIKRRLRDGHVEPLVEMPGAASHVSARNVQERDWVYVTYGERPDRKGRLPYEFEVVALKIDGSQTIRRLARTYAAPSGYLSEAHAAPSPDGSRVVWASNWGEPGGPISAYVTEIKPRASACAGTLGDASTRSKRSAVWLRKHRFPDHHEKRRAAGGEPSARDGSRECVSN